MTHDNSFAVPRFQNRNDVNQFFQHLGPWDEQDSALQDRGRKMVACSRSLGLLFRRRRQPVCLCGTGCIKPTFHRKP